MPKESTGELPRYDVVAQTYLDRLYEAGDTNIVWAGPPNKALVPLNDEAKAKVDEYETAKRRKVAPSDIGTKSVAEASQAFADMQARVRAAEDAQLAAEAEVEKLTAQVASLAAEVQSFKDAAEAGKK